MKPHSRKFALLALGGLVALALAGCGPEQFKPKTTGSEEYQKKVEQGQPLYTPPPGAPIPGVTTGGASGGMPPGAPTGAPPGAPGAPPGPPGAPR